MKTCTRCKIEFPEAEFKTITDKRSRNTLDSDGKLVVEEVERQRLSPYCATCTKLNWSEANERRRNGTQHTPSGKKTYADLTPEQKAARYEAVRRWRHAHADKSRSLDSQYKKMNRFLERTGDWKTICEHYKTCVGCNGPIEHIDHVNPISETDESRNCLANLQPVCMKCNSKKHGLHVDWRPDKGAFIIATFPHHSRPFSLKWVAK